MSNRISIKAVVALLALFTQLGCATRNAAFEPSPRTICNANDPQCVITTPRVPSPLPW
jgi:hypothetical protein